MIKKKQFRHSEMGASYQFACDDAKLFELIKATLHGYHNPPFEKDFQWSFAQKPAFKSPTARHWRCIAIPDPQRKILAIKMFRNVTGYGLAESKNWVEGTVSLPLDPHEPGQLWAANFVLVME